METAATEPGQLRGANAALDCRKMKSVKLQCPVQRLRGTSCRGQLAARGGGGVPARRAP